MQHGSCSWRCCGRQTNGGSEVPSGFGSLEDDWQMLDSHLTSHGSALSAFPTKPLLSALNAGMSAPHLRLSESCCSDLWVCIPLRWCVVDGEEIRWEEGIACEPPPKEQQTCREARNLSVIFVSPRCFLLFNPSLFIVSCFLYCISPFPLKELNV